ncbi:2Fe-2S iron-sulfur cluster-binding protein, partial [Reichenbachiella sp.]
MSYSFDIIDVRNEWLTIEFIPNKYDNLMILLYDRCIEEWGDCKGRAWCGTCHIEIVSGEIPRELDIDEKKT